MQNTKKTPTHLTQIAVVRLVEITQDRIFITFKKLTKF